MAYLGKSNFQRNREYLMGDDAVPAPSMDKSREMDNASKMPVQDYMGGMGTGSGGSLGGSGVQSAPEMDMQTTSAPQSTTKVEEQRPDGTQKTTTTSSQPVFKTTGSMNQRLYDPLTQQGQQGQQNLQQAANLFQQQAGPSRTFESIGGEGTVGRAVESGLGMDEARKLANAQYTGPAGLDPVALSDLQLMQQQMQTRQQALGTGGGLSGLIQGSAPGLTRGEAQFEAKRRLDESKVKARDLGYNVVNPFATALARKAEAARGFAGQRTAEEEAIQAATRGALGGRGDVISEDLQRAMEAASGQQTAAESAYSNIQEADPTGRLAAIQAATPYLAGGTAEDPTGLLGADVAARFTTPGMQREEEGRALKQQILDDPKYASIKEYNQLEQGVTKRGKAFYDYEGKDLRAVEKDAQKRTLLYERQRELESQFGTRKKGEYSTTNPLYYGDNFKSADPASYLGFNPGISPSRENVSSADQRDQYNRINDLLGNLDQIGEEQPFRAAKIFAEADRYLEDEEKALKAKGKSQTKEDLEWAGYVKKARKQYKKKRKSSQYGIISDAINLNPSAALKMEAVF